MNKQYKVSIIIPVHHNDGSLKECLEKILNQSFSDIEIICVDESDGNEIMELVSRISEQDPRVRYVKRMETDIDCCENIGLDHAAGDYVLFMNVEDVLMNYALESVLAKAEKYDADCVKFRVIPFDKSVDTTFASAKYELGKLRNGDYNRLLNIENDEAIYQINDVARTGLYRRSFLINHQIRFDNLPYFNDRSFYYRVVLSAEHMIASRDRVFILNVPSPLERLENEVNYYEVLLDSIVSTEKALKESGCSDQVYRRVLKRELDFLNGLAMKISDRDPERGVNLAEETEAFLVKSEFPMSFEYEKKMRDIHKKALKKLEEYEVTPPGEPKPPTPVNPKTYFYDRCDDPKVSVIVPIYNQEDYLNQALDSLSAQTLKELEFVCVNDGSTDSSMAILKQYAEVDQRIVIIDKANSGYGHSMNVGIDAAKGEYIGILEPDDYVSAGMFNELYNTASKNDLDLVKSNFYRFWGMEDGSQKQVLFKVGDDSHYDRVINPIQEPDVFMFTMNTWSGIYKTSFLNKYHIRHNETPGASYQDNGFWFQTFMYAERVWFMNKMFYMNRRDNPNSSMFNKGKFYAVTNEYNFIWEKLRAEPEKLAVLEGIFYRKKFHNFLVTYRRLASELKVDYLCHLRDEFQEPVAEGRVTEETLNPYYWDMLNQILVDPEAYYEQIRVSIIIPAYNAEKYIRQCLDSILIWNEIHMEVIVVDDGSSDDTPRILREYEARDPRVKVITQENSGAGAARNNGMKHAKGEYLLFLDADDFFEPQLPRIAYENAWKNQSDVVVWRSDNYLESKRTFSDLSGSIRKELLPENMPFAGVDVPHNIFKLFVGWPWDKMFRADFVRENGLTFQEQRTTNDMLFVFSAIVKAQSISIINTVYSHHRRLDDGESLSVSREKSWDCFYHALIALRDQLIAWDLYDRFERDFINYSLHFSLWNLNTIKGEAYEKLYSSLKNGWFGEFGISSKPEYYFYNNSEYKNYLAVCELDADEYLFYRIDKLTNERNGLTDAKNKLTNEKNKLTDEKNKLTKQKKDIENQNKKLKKKSKKAEKDLEKIRNSTSFKVGRTITYIPRKIKNTLKH